MGGILMAYDKAKMQAWTNSVAVYWWNHCTRIFGVSIGKMPTVEMNARLTATGGRAFLKEGRMDFSCFLMERNYKEFRDQIIPHELCHFIAYRLFHDDGHGKPWKWCMMRLGLAPDTFHQMETKYQLSRRK